MFIELVKFPYLSLWLIIASYFIQCLTFTSGYFNIPLQKTFLCSLHMFNFPSCGRCIPSSSGHCSMNFFSDQQRPIQEETKTSEVVSPGQTHPASQRTRTYFLHRVFHIKAGMKTSCTWCSLMKISKDTKVITYSSSNFCHLRGFNHCSVKRI